MNLTEQFLRHYVRVRPLFLSTLRAKEAALYQSHVPLPRPVLDVGCGDGEFARITFGKKKIDVGLDMEGSRIGEAIDKEAYRRTVTYDGRRIPFRNRFFRTVVINSVLEHVEHICEVISEMHRVLASGGICYATVMAAPWQDHLFGAKIFGDWYRRWMKKKQVHINLLTVGEWKKEFSRAGFTIVSVTPYGSPKAAMWLDILHYVSFPSLVCYILWKRWVVWPSLTAWYPVSWLAQLMDEPVSPEEASALFFVLKRTHG